MFKLRVFSFSFFPDFGIYSIQSDKIPAYKVHMQHIGWKHVVLCLMGTNKEYWNPKMMCFLSGSVVIDLQLQAECPCQLFETFTYLHAKAHTPTLYPANLQPSGSPDCVCSKVQLAPFQSAIEHIPSLCFLYRPIKIFPLIASLLQVRKIVSG